MFTLFVSVVHLWAVNNRPIMDEYGLAGQTVRCVDTHTGWLIDQAVSYPTVAQAVRSRDRFEYVNEVNEFAHSFGVFIYYRAGASL